MYLHIFLFAGQYPPAPAPGYGTPNAPGYGPSPGGYGPPPAGYGPPPPGYQPAPGPGPYPPGAGQYPPGPVVTQPTGPGAQQPGILLVVLLVVDHFGFLIRFEYTAIFFPFIGGGRSVDIPWVLAQNYKHFIGFHNYSFSTCCLI